MSCKRSDAFFEARGLTVRETVDARKQRYGADDLKGLFKGAKAVITGRGKKSQSFKLGAKTDWDALAKAALGPSGNLRAPTLKTQDKTILVGYCEPAWEEYFDG